MDREDFFVAGVVDQYSADAVLPECSEAPVLWRRGGSFDAASEQGTHFGVGWDGCESRLRGDRSAGVAPPEVQRVGLVAPEAQQISPAEVSANALEAAFTCGAGEQCDNAPDDPTDPCARRFAQGHRNPAALWQAVRIQGIESSTCHDVGRSDSRARMSGEFYGILVTVLQHAAFGCAKEFGKGVAQPQSARLVKEGRKLHGSRSRR